MPKKNRTNKRQQKGGFGPGAGPVGHAWDSDPKSWPGVSVLAGGNTDGVMSSNHYSLSPYGGAVGGVQIAEPEVKFSGLAGGSASKKRKCRKTRTRKHNKHRNHMRMRKHNKSQLRRTKYNRKTKHAHRSRKYKKSLRMRGGFGPQDIVNVFRGAGHGLSNTFNNFMGYEHSPNPSPLEQPINSNDFPENIIAPDPINLKRSFDLAGRTAATM